MRELLKSTKWLMAMTLCCVTLACGPTDPAAGGGDGNCESGEFTCGSDECIPVSMKCNGRDNCADGSDEDDCIDKCDSRSDFRCKDGVTCISKFDVCDGREQCPGGDDESTCATKSCDGFECSDGTCIDADKKCNGQADCLLAEDESAANCAPERCANATDMRCRDGETCVPKDKVCDGTPHCPGREYESDVLCKKGTGDQPPGDQGTDEKGTGTGSGKPTDTNPSDSNPTDSGPGKPGSTPPSDRPCGSVTAAGMCEANSLIWCDNGVLAKRNCRVDGRVCGRKDTVNGFTCLTTADTPPQVNDCGTITERGQCDGDNLTFCHRGQIRTQNCARRNKSCGLDNDRFTCTASVGPTDPPPPAMSTCETLGFTGECNGDTLRWCDATSEIREYDCSSAGQACGFVDATTGNDCLAAPCGSVTYQGTCSGDTLTYCASNERLVTIDCQAQFGMGCGLQNAEIGNNCLPAAGALTACGDIDFMGTCNGNTVTWCSGDELKEYDCGVLDAQCGWFDDSIGHWCVQAASSCGDIDFLGTCQGDTVLWCDNNGSLKNKDCSADGRTCGDFGGSIGFWCMQSTTTEPEGGTCSAACGTSAPQGSGPACYCDSLCGINDDCCGDYEALCSAGPPPPPPAVSCEGHCGETTAVAGSSPSCYCDELCAITDDCCSDYDSVCSTAPAADSCVGYCDQTTPVPGSSPACYCDEICNITDDCCDDRDAVCPIST